MCTLINWQIREILQTSTKTTELKYTLWYMHTTDITLVEGLNSNLVTINSKRLWIQFQSKIYETFCCRHEPPKCYITEQIIILAIRWLLLLTTQHGIEQPELR